MTDILVRIDRRAEVVDELRRELVSLSQSVEGLTVAFVDEDGFEQARDAGKFRDFVAVASLSHQEPEVLEWAAEELVDEFGWLVDIGRDQG